MSNHSFEKDVYDEHMGLMTSYRFRHDPKTVLFQLARYKWVAKMLTGYARVLEVGCGDGFGSQIVAASVGDLVALDQDQQMIDDAWKHRHGINFLCGTMSVLKEHHFDAVYALDVLEHVEAKNEDDFLLQMTFLAPVGIIGMPSAESQSYASPLSAANHVNCKTEEGLRETMRRHYNHVFMFTMNDEMVGTGFGPLAHYRFALGVK